MADWNTMGKGGENKPLHQKTGAPKRAAPPAASPYPNKPLHDCSVPHAANKPLHNRSAGPKRSKPPSGTRGKTF